MSYTLTSHNIQMYVHHMIYICSDLFALFYIYLNTQVTHLHVYLCIWHQLYTIKHVNSVYNIQCTITVALANTRSNTIWNNNPSKEKW